jgi:YEATS domain-containing protein 1/3
VVKQPPYHVIEVGNADFGLPIEIYFRNIGEPQEIKFNYNLFLQAHELVNYVRCEKLTFVNPTDEFERKLIKAGGVCIIKLSCNCFSFDAVEYSCTD